MSFSRNNSGQKIVKFFITNHDIAHEDFKMGFLHEEFS